MYTFFYGVTKIVFIIMNVYSSNSQANLDSADVRLQRIFIEALQVMDHSIICGYRTEQDQLALYLEKKSKVRLGEHNCKPSRAIDAIPYPINPDWEKDKDKIILFAGIVLGIAYKNKVKVRWGGDWDGDKDLKDQLFYDLVHFELVRE